MRVLALAGLTSGALLGGVDERQGSGRRAGAKEQNAAPRNAMGKGKYTVLVETFGTMKGETQVEKDNFTTDFNNEKQHCTDEIAFFTEEIEKFETEMKTQTEAKVNAKKKMDALDAKIEKDTKLKDDLVAQKQNGQATYERTSARMAGDRTNLEGAQGAIVTLMADADGKFFGGLSAASKTRMEQTIGNLKQKIENQLSELVRAIEDGVKFHGRNQQDLKRSIGQLTATIGGDTITLGAETKNRDDASTAAGAAKQSMMDNQRFKTQMSSQCDENLRTLTDLIDDSNNRIAALTKAISILGGSAAAGEKEQKSTTMVAGAIDHVALLQTSTSFLAKPDPKAKLQAQIQVMQKEGMRGAAILKAALEVSPSQQEAFVKIINEIHTMFDQMDEEDKADTKSQAECQTTQDRLESDQSSQTDDRDKLQSEHDSIVSTMEVLQSKMDQSNADHKRAREDMVENTNLIQKDISDNNLEREQLKKDLSNLQQAEGVLQNEFSGKSDQMSNTILSMVADLIVEYEESITHSEREDRTLKREQESNEKNGKAVMRQQDRLHKRLNTDHGNNNDRKTVVETERRDVRAELRATEKAISTIFTQDDGRCHNYKEVYPARIEARNGEREQLKGAKKSLKEYMVSIGIRVN